MLKMFKSIAFEGFVDTTLTKGHDDVSKWLGVTVENDRVVKIDWSHFGLKNVKLGGNPEAKSNPYKANLLELTDLWKFKELKELYLQNQNFVGIIPAEWAQLQNLEHFSLAKNPYVSGGIPHELERRKEMLGQCFKIDKPMDMTRIEYNNREHDKKIVFEAWLRMGGKEEVRYL